MTVQRRDSARSRTPRGGPGRAPGLRAKQERAGQRREEPREETCEELLVREGEEVEERAGVDSGGATVQLRERGNVRWVGERCG